MTPVALPPPAVASAQNIHLPERALRKPTRKDGPPQNETMLPNGALNNIQLPERATLSLSRRAPSK